MTPRAAARTVDLDQPPRLPYPPRAGQEELAHEAKRAALAGYQAVLEAGTGTGKTIAVLAAALEAAVATDRRVVYLTRTNSQARQVMVEFRRLTDGAPERPLALALQGRTHLCPELRDDPRYAGATAEELSRLCGARKRRTLHDAGRTPWGVRTHADPETDEEKAPERPRARAPPRLPMAAIEGCRFYQGLLATDPHALRDELARDPQEPERLAAQLEARGVCPYEAVKGLLSEARLIVAPYIYLADPRLARAMQDWMLAPLSECIVVVDEAHNLPEYLRGLHSPELSLESLRRAYAEAAELGDPQVRDGLAATAFIGVVEAAMHDIATERLLPGEEDALVPPDELTVNLLSSLGGTTLGLTAAIEAMLTLGDTVRAAQQRQGKLPRSYLGALGSFLAAWLNASPAEHVHVVIGDDDGPRLVLWCLDPAIGAEFLAKAHASIHISGTLRPLEQYRDLLGLPSDTRLRHWPSPFPPEHLRLVLIDDVTMRYEDRQRDPAIMDRLLDHLGAFAAVPGVNGAVFFPSHALLDEARQFALQGAERRVFVERPGLTQAELMASLEVFRAQGHRTRHGGAGALWLGVMGGRVAEGMDFPGATLEAAALVGVPFPKPTARQRALVRFNEIRYGKGWEYAVEAPTLRRVLQAVGRVIRDAEDRGIVFLLDARFRRYGDDLPRLERLGDAERIGDVLTAWVAAQRSAPVPVQAEAR